jgi:hypothetical protein
MLFEQQQKMSLPSNVREWTHIVLVNTPCSYLHRFWATDVSSGLATTVTLTQVSRGRLRQSVTHSTWLLLCCVLNHASRNSQVCVNVNLYLINIIAFINILLYFYIISLAYNRFCSITNFLPSPTSHNPYNELYCQFIFSCSVSLEYSYRPQPGKSTHNTSFSRSTGETDKHYKLYSQFRRLYDQETNY